MPQGRADPEEAVLAGRRNPLSIGEQHESRDQVVVLVGVAGTCSSRSRRCWSRHGSRRVSAVPRPPPPWHLPRRSRRSCSPGHGGGRGRPGRRRGSSPGCTTRPWGCRAGESAHGPPAARAVGPPFYPSMTSPAIRPFARPPADHRFETFPWGLVVLVGWGRLISIAAQRGRRRSASTRAVARGLVPATAGQPPYDAILAAGGALPATSHFHSCPPLGANAARPVGGDARRMGSRCDDGDGPCRPDSRAGRGGTRSPRGPDMCSFWRGAVVLAQDPTLG